MKTYKKLLLIIVALVFTFAGCKKYEDGPTISLLPKKWRVDNTWKIDKVLENGQDVTSAYNAILPGYTMEMKKDNTYTDNYTGGSASTGKWAFDSKKESITMTPDGGSSATTLKILKLKNSEMWLTDNDPNTPTEIHYVSSK